TRVLPGARTVCVLAMPYRDPTTEAFGIAAPDASRAEISSYARGTDYHRVLEARLRAACEALAREHPDERFRWYVDTGPLLEKAWAAAAGIGWIGKNTCSIHPRHGSFFFLAAIMTTLELEPDAPAVDHCGSCRLCLDACPTGALVEPYVLDARRCLSYTTIELRGEVPPEIEAASGNIVFGCDICQEVCPWNRDPEGARSDPELAPREENIFPLLEDLLATAASSPEAFAARFPKSAVRRPKARGFLRNVIIACGNSGRPELRAALDELERRDDLRTDPIIGPTLARALGRLRSEAGP
ncbi:MAG TPA: tRNA epoxyqueuosine(34) reductase QueG, partial [Planctomycetota bacterium]|nr:tRNA epoxyqueuosine(34) reductase QueG [Planctomycetota bacterium]